MIIKCGAAKKYRGQREPRCGCRTCWRRWVSREATRWAGEELKRYAQLVRPALQHVAGVVPS